MNQKVVQLGAREAEERLNEEIGAGWTVTALAVTEDNVVLAVLSREHRLIVIDPGMDRPSLQSILEKVKTRAERVEIDLSTPEDADLMGDFPPGMRDDIKHGGPTNPEKPHRV